MLWQPTLSPFLLLVYIFPSVPLRTVRHIFLGNKFLTFILFFFSLLQSICSLLHVNKIFEVGMSENLKENMKYFNLDIVEKVLNNIFFYSLLLDQNAILKVLSKSLFIAGQYMHYNRVGLCL